MRDELSQMGIEAGARAPDAGGNALHGTRVLEIGHYIAGPYASMVLADMGADVVKVEPPGGEPGRRALPLTGTGESLYYASYNRNKRAVALDLKACAPDREVLVDLIRWADVVITNYSPDVPEKLGFGWDTVHELNPRAVMVQISGFGSWSALGEYLSYDGIVQAMAGLASLSGEKDGAPQPSAAFICDHVTGIQAALAAASGLLARGSHGTGAFIEVSMQRSAAALLGVVVPQADHLGVVATRTGGRADRTFTNVFETADGHVVISPNSAKMWAELCAKIGRPEWGTKEISESRRNVLDPEFRASLDAAVTAWTKRSTSDAVMEDLQDIGVPCGAVRSVDGVCRDDDTFGLRVLQTVALSDGNVVRVVGSPFDINFSEEGNAERIRLSAEPAVVRPVNADIASVLADVGIAPTARS